MWLHHRVLALVLPGSILNIKKRKEESLLVKAPERQFRNSSIRYCMGLCVEEGGEWQETHHQELPYLKVTHISFLFLFLNSCLETVFQTWSLFNCPIINLIVSPKFTFISNQQHNPATTVQCRTDCSQAVNTRGQRALVSLRIQSRTDFPTAAIAPPSHSLHHILSVYASTALKIVNIGFFKTNFTELA